MGKKSLLLSRFLPLNKLVWARTLAFQPQKLWCKLYLLSMWCKILWNVVSPTRLRAGCILVVTIGYSVVSSGFTRQTKDYAGKGVLRCSMHSNWCNSKWFCHMYPPHITVCGEGIRVDGLANAKVLGLLVVYSEFMESWINGPPLQPSP